MKGYGPGGVGGWAWWAFGCGSLTRRGCEGGVWRGVWFVW